MVQPVTYNAMEHAKLAGILFCNCQWIPQPHHVVTWLICHASSNGAPLVMERWHKVDQISTSTFKLESTRPDDASAYTIKLPAGATYCPAPRHRTEKGWPWPRQALKRHWQNKTACCGCACCKVALSNLCLYGLLPQCLKGKTTL